jgi:hypothetical protein
MESLQALKDVPADKENPKRRNQPPFANCEGWGTLRFKCAMASEGEPKWKRDSDKKHPRNGEPKREKRT